MQATSNVLLKLVLFEVHSKSQGTRIRWPDDEMQELRKP